MRELENKCINGYDFDYNKDENYFECRGEVCWDDEHDQVPEPGLWRAASKLVLELKELGYTSSKEHSEKGWVEVQVQMNKTIQMNLAARLWLLIPMDALNYYKERYGLESFALCERLVELHIGWAEIVTDDGDTSTTDLMHDIEGILSEDEHFLPRIEI